jgi:UDP-glucose 4-epimerase
VVVLDDVSRGHSQALPEGVPFYEGRIGDRELVTKICKEHNVEACVHFAALAYVGESVTDPKTYFENNVAQGIGLLDALLESGVRRFIFSSTCATYGEPVRVPIDESHPQAPTNTYGWSKLFMEKILNAYDNAYGLKYVALRYFNASGAAGPCGEHHEPETHLIPNVLFAAMGKLPFVSVFGDDFQTPDGTAIRDYIHVSDLASAHVQALHHLRRGGASEFINLGNGQGYSVMEVIDAARRVTGRPIETRIEPARAGDPSKLVADASKAKTVLGWKPQFPDLETIIRTAWDWHQAHPGGYGEEEQ